MKHSNQSKSRAEINRENAQKSTGPKTEEGKRISSLNARRHDLTGQIIVLPEAEMEEYLTFTYGFHKDKKPQGAIELNLVQQYADVNWRMNHSAAIEKVKLSLTIDDERDSVDTECTPAHNSFVEARNYHLYSETLRNISLYETRLSSRAGKLLKQINEIQAERRAREEKEMGEAVLMYEMEQEAHAEHQTAAPRPALRLHSVRRWLRFFNPANQGSNPLPRPPHRRSQLPESPFHSRVAQACTYASLWGSQSWLHPTFQAARRAPRPVQ